MKDLGEANYILGIQIIKDIKNRFLALFQALYIGKVFFRFVMQNSKKGTYLLDVEFISPKNSVPKQDKKR